MHDAEAEAYQRIKEQNQIKAEKALIDDGRPKPIGRPSGSNRTKKDKKAKQDLRMSARGALNATNMHYHAEEKHIHEYHRSKFIDMVKEEKGSISIVDELIIDVLAYAVVRLFRKSRMESDFGRFMDRTAPQDPVAQILSCIKSLNLKNSLKGNETDKEVLSKLLGSDAEDMNSSGNTLSFEEWQKLEDSKGPSKIVRRALTDFAVDEEYYKTPEELEKEDQEQGMNNKPNMNMNVDFQN